MSNRKRHGRRRANRSTPSARRTWFGYGTADNRWPKAPAESWVVEGARVEHRADRYGTFRGPVVVGPLEETFPCSGTIASVKVKSTSQGPELQVIVALDNVAGGGSTPPLPIREFYQVFRRVEPPVCDGCLHGHDSHAHNCPRFDANGPSIVSVPANPDSIDPAILVAVDLIWKREHPIKEGGTAELDENGVVILRDAAGNFEAACPEEVWWALRAAPAPAPMGIVSAAALFGLEGLVVPQRRASLGEEAKCIVNEQRAKAQKEAP